MSYDGMKRKQDGVDVATKFWRSKLGITITVVFNLLMLLLLLAFCSAMGGG